MVESVATVRNNIRSTNVSVVKMTRTQVSFHTQQHTSNIVLQALYVNGNGLFS